MRWLGRRYGCRDYSSYLFLGCPIDLELVNKRRLKSSSGEPALPSDTNNKSEDDDDYDDGFDDYDEMFEFVSNYVREKHGSHFYLGQAIVGPDLTEWTQKYEVFLAIRLPEERTIPELTRFFTDFDSSVLDRFRNLMKLL